MESMDDLQHLAAVARSSSKRKRRTARPRAASGRQLGTGAIAAIVAGCLLIGGLVVHAFQDSGPDESAQPPATETRNIAPTQASRAAKDAAPVAAGSSAPSAGKSSLFDTGEAQRGAARQGEKNAARR
jgi:hypothetical protein